MKKKSMTDKLSLIEAFLLLIVSLCYVGTLYFIVTDNRPYLIVFFVLHSCLTLIFLLILHEKLVQQALQHAEDRPSPFEEEKQVMETYCNEIASLKKEREALLTEKEQLAKQYETTQAHVKELESSLTEAQSTLSNEPMDSGLNHLLPQEEEPVDLNIIACANKVLEEMTPFGKTSGIQLQLSSASDSLMVRADASYIRILLRNIIDNSIKYMKRNGSLVITISNIGDDLFIVLKDNGEGLPTNETPHIFELNYQGSNRISGNGLGLTQAKAIVDYYGGTIYAKSESGKGMGVYIQLPMKRL